MYGTYAHGNKTESLVKAAIGAGITAFDSAAFGAPYDEKSLAQAILTSNIARDEVWLQTKFTPSSNYYNTDIALPQQVWQSLQISLNNFHTAYLDAYIVHCKTAYGAKINDQDLTIWQEMEHVYRSGRVNYIGHSNLDLDDLKTILANSTIKPTFLQNCFNYKNRSEYIILEFCLENAIVYQAWGLLRNDELLKHQMISSIANDHNVTNAQVLIKFAQAIGIQPLTGGSSEKRVTDNANLDFALSKEEIYEIISISQDKELLASLYEKLQDGRLMTLKDIVSNLINCQLSDIEGLFNKISHYIDKLDATSLSLIIAKQELFIIDYLKKYHANFNDITSKACAEIVSLRGAEYLDILKTQLNIPAEKLLLASLNFADNIYFNALLQEADLSKVNEDDILQIITHHPELVEHLRNNGVALEKLLVAAAILDHKDHFDSLINEVDLSKLNNYDLLRIIKNKPIEVFDLLKHKGANFAQLNSQDVEILVESYQSVMLIKLQDISPKITHALLVPALQLGDVDLFNEIAKKINLTSLDLSTLEKIITIYPKSLDLFIAADVKTDFLLLAVIENTDLLKMVLDKADINNLSESYEAIILSSILSQSNVLTDIK
jgi:diketogulonate reductase-like aldo/keto reductase